MQRFPHGPACLSARVSARVAVVTTSWPASEDDGAGHFVRAEARALENAGHEVIIVAAPSGGPGCAFGWPGVAARLREKPARVFDATRWVARARARVAKLEVERVVAHWAVPCGWPIGAVSRGSLHVVSHGGDVRLIAKLPPIIRSHVVRVIAARAERWRFVSEPLLVSLLEALGRECRARVERIAFIEAAVLEMPDVREEVTQRRRSLASLRVAVAVARLVASKRIDRAIEYVASSTDVDALIVVGDGPERPRLERLARRCGVDARFVGTVSRRESLAWIGAADFLIHSSSAEGMSTVVREAEALGTAILRLEPA